MAVIEQSSAYVAPIRARAGRFDGGVYDLDGAPLEAAVHRRGAVDNVHQPTPVRRDEISAAPRDDEPHLYVGFLFNHFGHFLIESLGRLWATRADVGKTAKILYLPVWGVINVRNGDHYIGATLNALGVDPERVSVLTAPKIYANLWIPEQLYGFNQMQNPDRRIIDLFRSASKIPAQGGDGAIYVSRSRLNIKLGRIAGEEAFEDYMASQGYEILYPEQLPFPEQLRRYRSASRLVFCEGSAMHASLLFSTTKAKIAIVLRRADSAGWIKRFFASLRLKAHILEAVQRRDICGLADHMGVSVVDFLAVSVRLAELGFVQDVYSHWPLVKREAIAAHYRNYIASVEREPGFVHPDDLPI